MSLGLHWMERFAIDNEFYQKRCKSEELRREVLEILSSSRLDPMIDLIEEIASEENRETERKRKIYFHMIEHYPGTLSLKLLHIFRRFESAFHLRVLSLCLLRILFLRLRKYSVSLCPTFISFLKPDLVSSLSREIIGGNFKILSKIVSLVASNVFEWKTGEWDALRDFISSELDKSKPEKGLIVFRDLPLNTGREFLAPIIAKIFIAITKELKSRDIKSWLVAFVAAFNFVLIIPSVPRHKRKLRGIMVNDLTQSTAQLVENGDEDFVISGMHNLVAFVTEKAESFSTGDREFLKDLISMITGINGVGDSTKRVAFSLLLELEKNSIAAQMLSCDSKQDERECKDRRTSLNI